MKSEAIQIARLQRDSAVAQAALAEVGKLAQNPMLQLIGGYVVIETLQQGERPVFGPVAGTALESALTLTVVLGALGKAAEAIPSVLAALPLLSGLKALPSP